MIVMKYRLLFVSLFCFLAMGASAQDLTDVEFDSLAQREETSLDFRMKVRAVSRELAREEIMATRSQLRIGTGFNINSLGALSYLSYNTEYDVKRLNEGFNVPVFVEYGYRVWDFLEVVGCVHYMGNSGFELYEDRVDGQYVGFVKEVDDFRMFSFGVYARYSWLNREWFSLYSGLGAWVMTNHEFVTDGVGSTTYRCDVGFLPEIMPIGIKFGKEVFGFFEPVAMSMRGQFCTLGIGARF